MIFFTLTIRYAVVGVAMLAAMVGVLGALLGAALATGDTHLATFDDDLGDDALALFEETAA